MLPRLSRPVLWAGLAAALAGPAAAQLEPTLIRGPYLQSPTPESIVVRWRTDLPSDRRVRFGTDPAALDREAGSPQLDTEHQVLLTGLAPATRYFYAVGGSPGDLASGPDLTFVTPPVPGTRQPIRIWTFGDSGWGSIRGEAREVRDAYLGFTGARGTDVWLLLGDNAYAAGSDAEYQSNFFEIYPRVLRRVPAWSTFGNHENFFAHSLTGTGPYYDLFTFPRQGEAGGEPSGTEAWFSFDYGNVHFVNLNSQDVDRSPGSPMLEWLERDLAANTREWTIAFFHHPVYSFGTHHSDDDTGRTSVTPPTPLDDFAIQEMRANVLPILEAGGVDVVLTAHSHNYERSVLLDGHYGHSSTLTDEMKLDGGKGRPAEDRPYRKTGDVFNDAHSGTVYAVVGTGAESFPAGDHPAMAETVDAPGSLVIDVDGSRLDGAFVDRDGRVRDTFTILRGDGFNFPPIARDDAAATAPLVPVTIDVLANDSDPDDDLVRIETVGAPGRGTATLEPDGRVTYAPGPDLLAGTDAFTYTIGDGRGHTASATVTVTVACPPVADGAFADDLEPAPAAGWTVETAHNEQPASTTWSAVEDPGASSPTHSWFSESSASTLAKDDRLMAPPLDLSSASRLTFRHRYDFEFSFDGGVLEISADGGDTWTDLGPWILTGGYHPVETIDIDSVDRPAWTGRSGDAMEAVEVDLGAFAGFGRLVRWRLVADFFTPDVTEGWYVDDVAASALITGPGSCNLPPRAVDDRAETPAGASVAIDVLANDSDPNGDPIAVSAVDGPARGEAVLQGDGRIRYTPEPGFAGEDAFGYEISDGQLTAGATVRVTVFEPPFQPTRVRGNGEILAGLGEAEFALNARVDAGGASGWIEYDSDEDSDSTGAGGSGGGGGSEDDFELEGWVGSLVFPTPTRAELTGVCWLDDGAPCTFRATAEDAPGGGPGLDRFGIEVFDPSGRPIHAAEGPLIEGRVVVD